MKIIEIFVGKPETVQFRGRDVTTAFFKKPIHGPVKVRKTTLDGDQVADLSVHGGEFKAVYAYSIGAFADWRRARPNDQFVPGCFGENLAIDDFNENEIFIGDSFKVGSAILKAVQPRFPCHKLGVKFNDLKILKEFIRMNRPGIYFSVEQEGSIEAGDALTHLQREQSETTIQRLFEIFHGSRIEATERERILAVKSLPPEMREQLLST